MSQTNKIKGFAHKTAKYKGGPNEGQPVKQLILRLTKSEAVSPDWEKLFRERLGDKWNVRKPYHRMGDTNEVHKGNPADCPRCQTQSGSKNKDTSKGKKKND